MIKNIYHGSSRIIRKPEFGLSRTYNDFGSGFYCTEDPSEASEWAVDRGRNGFVSSYSINCSGLRIIDLCSHQYTVMHWIALLLNYREFDGSSRLIHRAIEYVGKEFAVDAQAADCIIGYPADNSFFTLAAMFLNGKLPYQSLKSALSVERLGRQFVLKSNRAFDRILYTGYRSASSAEVYPSKVSQELLCMRRACSEAGSDGLYITQMIEEEIKAYDSRLR